MYHLRRITIFLTLFLCVSFLAWFLPRYLDPTPPDKEKQIQDKRWVSSSPYWLDRQACRWFSLCGVHHLSWDPAALLPNWNKTRDDLFADRLELRSLSDDEVRHAGWANAPRKRSPGQRKAESAKAPRHDAIPDYVLKYAPLVHLYSGENFWPSDIAEHVQHMIPYLEDESLNQTALLSDLHDLNKQDGRVFLTADEDVELRPKWLHNQDGIPQPWDDEDESEGDEQGGRASSSGRRGSTWFDASRDHPVHRLSDPRRPDDTTASQDASGPISRRDQIPLSSEPSSSTYKPNEKGYSKAPAVLVLVDKGHGIVDAFWFFFYSYNLGQTVLNLRFGNHVGDWEHCMVRFEHGEPRGIFFSEHEGGQAYTYNAVEKKDGRPVIYSAVGSHAMYAQPGNHPYVLPFKMLKDVTDRGPLWDPAKNTYSYWYDYAQDLGDGLDLDDDFDGEVEFLATHHNANATSLTPTSDNPDAPTSWFHYAGPWGDQVYSLADLRQWRLFSQYHYVTGPLGPKFKRLGREKLCITNRCRILDSLEPGQTWYG